MNDRLKRIDEELAAELTQIDAALREIDGRRGELLKERERVASSLAALRAGETRPSKKRGRPLRPCATKAEVESVVRRLIEQNGPCPEDDLIGLAEARLREEGRSLSGFKLRFRGVRQELLAVTPDGRLGLNTTQPQERTTT